MGVLPSFSVFSTMEYEMPLENENLEEFKIRVPKPKFRCRSCWEKHAHELKDTSGKRNSVVRGREIKGINKYNLVAHVIGK